MSDAPQLGLVFHGPLAPEDPPRLTGQLARVEAKVIDGRWRTVPALRVELGDRDSETGLAARLRQLRSLGYTVDRRRVSAGLYEYRVTRGTP